MIAALEDDGTPLVLFGSCGGAVTAVRAAQREPRVRAVVGYALPVVLTGGRGAELSGLRGLRRLLAMARLGLGEAILRVSGGRLLPGAPGALAERPADPRAARAWPAERPVLLLFGGEDDVQDQLGRYGLDRLEGVDLRRACGHRPPLRRSARRGARRVGHELLAGAALPQP